MKVISKYTHPQGLKFNIEHDKNVGYYFYAYDANGINTHDYLQDTLSMAKEQALEDFGVPIELWVEI